LTDLCGNGLFEIDFQNTSCAISLSKNNASPLSSEFETNQAVGQGSGLDLGHFQANVFKPFEVFPCRSTAARDKNAGTWLQLMQGTSLIKKQRSARTLQ
jgi:hypothetical protein